MATHPSSTVVGVFTDRSMAEQAMQTLHDAGVSDEQIRYLGAGSSGGLLEDLKSLFTGSTSNGDLSGLGLSDEEVHYYSNEYNKGNSVIAVTAPGHEEDVLSVLNRYSAYNYRNDPAGVTSGAPGNVVQGAAGADAANYASPHSFTATETPPTQYATDSAPIDTAPASYTDQNVANPSPASDYSGTENVTSDYSTTETAPNSYSSTETVTDNSANGGTPLEASATDAYQHTSSDDGYANAVNTPSESAVVDYEQTPLVDASVTDHPMTSANDVIAAPERGALPASSSDVATGGDTVPMDGNDAVSTTGGDTVPMDGNDAGAATDGDALPVAEGDALPIVDDNALPIAESHAATTTTNDTVPITQSDVVVTNDTSSATGSDVVALPTSDAAATPINDVVNPDDTAPVISDEPVPASNGAQATYADQQDYNDVDALARQQTDKLAGGGSGVQAAQDTPTLEGQQENDPDVYEARVQDAHSRLQDYQQQLQDARARLQAAKQREAQLQAAHQRYQEVQTQLQSVQSELEATLAELKETQSRIDQYR